MFEHARKTSLGLAFALLSLPIALAQANPPAAAYGRLPANDSPFLAQVRQATAPYKDINAAAQAGWVGRDPFCVSGPDRGAMGIHVTNPALISGNQPDVNEPQILIYEPQADGSMVLVGVEYVVLADLWDAAHPTGPAPSVGGQFMLKFPAPNMFNMPSIYVLHAWAWRNNPVGNFALWNRNVTCQKQQLPAFS
jgi:hypothetical protein